MLSMRAKVKDAEEVNLNLEKRIDLLTSLLVISPPGSILVPSSPCKIRGHRSRCMLPKGPLSPGGIRLSLNTGVEGLFSDPKRVDSNSNILHSSAEMSEPIKEDERENLLKESTGTWSSSRASASSGSIPTFSSRPTSIESASSVGLTSPEGLSGLVESQKPSAIRQLKMRRFHLVIVPWSPWFYQKQLPYHLSQLQLCSTPFYSLHLMTCLISQLIPWPHSSRRVNSVRHFLRLIWHCAGEEQQNSM